MLLCVGFLSAENQAEGFKSFVAFCHVGGCAGPLGAWGGALVVSEGPSARFLQGAVLQRYGFILKIKNNAFVFCIC